MATTHQLATLEKKIREYRKSNLAGRKKSGELNESATRIFVNEFLKDVLGYAFGEEIKTEYAIKGEYADYVIQLKRKKHFVVEVKAMDIDLNERHLNQALAYATNEGIDWIVLFNGRQIQLYRVIFGKPIKTQRVFNFDLSDLAVLKAASSEIVFLTKQSVTKNDLEVYWKRFDALSKNNMVKTLFTKEVLKGIRLKIKKQSGINFSESEILASVHELVVKPNIDVSLPRSLKD